MTISDQALDILRRKLQFKVRHYLGFWCPDIDDVVQESIVRLLRAETQGIIRNPSAWAAFASAICNNVIHEYRRNVWRDTPSKLQSEEPRTACHFAALEARDLVEKLVGHLPARDQQVLRAFYLEGKSRDQICTEIGMSPSHLRVTLFRAKERLRKILPTGLE
jgi:RNA polymerase sigma-70 factor (ECF subfamily)